MRSKINFTKMDQADLDSPRQELSNEGLESVVALTIFLGIDFSSARIDVQSSCSNTV